MGWFWAPAQTSLAQEVLLGLTSVGGAQGLGTAFSINSTGSNFSVRKTFGTFGVNPAENLCQGTDGNFYGLASQRGAHGYGAIFKMTAAGQVTILYNFRQLDGTSPLGSLVQGADGNFYGMTNQGGTNAHGTIFKVTPAGYFTVLHHLNSVTDGAYPMGSLVQGTDRNFYGMTFQGGSKGTGTIFKITASGAFTVLRHLTAATDGGNPYGNLVQGTDGYFYGLTSEGGSKYGGTIFRITSSGTFTVRRHLSHLDGSYPHGSLVKATDGNFYGMTSEGGQNYYGTIFRMTPGGTFTILHHFNYSTDGAYQKGSLVQGKDGRFYGITSQGGSKYYGTFFQITSSGTFAVLRHLDEAFDLLPGTSLIQGKDSNFYGMSYSGGLRGQGTIFRLTAAGDYAVLVSFPEEEVALPLGGLMQAEDGSFYGTTFYGGLENFGAIFKLCNSTFSVIRSLDYSFTGAHPAGNLIQGADGELYGMTSRGGFEGQGTIFKVNFDGLVTVLHHLHFEDGIHPNGSLVQGSDGNFYGMTSRGGKQDYSIGGSTDAGISDYGTIFRLTPSGSFTVLHCFDHSATGASPQGSLIQGSDGNFYGMTSQGGTYGGGTIFKVTSYGMLTVLRHLQVTTDGGTPNGGLVQGKDGNFYGVTYIGGKNGKGTIFQITSNGTYTVLHHLNESTDGSLPRGTLVAGADGGLYGLTQYGGTYGTGTIFKMASTGSFTVLRHLQSDTDGGNPVGNLVIQKANPTAQAQN